MTNEKDIINKIEGTNSSDQNKDFFNFKSPELIANPPNFTEIMEILKATRLARLNQTSNLTTTGSWGLLHPDQVKSQLVIVKKRALYYIPGLTEDMVVTMIAIGIVAGSVAGLAIVIYVLIVMIQKFRTYLFQRRLQDKKVTIEKKLNDNNLDRHERRFLKERLAWLKKSLEIRGGAIMENEFEAFERIKGDGMILLNVFVKTVESNPTDTDWTVFNKLKEDFENEQSWLNSVLKTPRKGSKFYHIRQKAISKAKKGRDLVIRSYRYANRKRGGIFKRIKTKWKITNETINKNWVLIIVLWYTMIILCSGLEVRGNSRLSQQNRHSELNFPVCSSITQTSINTLEGNETRVESRQAISKETKTTIETEIPKKNTNRVIKKRYRYRTISDLDLNEKFEEVSERAETIESPIKLPIRVKE